MFPPLCNVRPTHKTIARDPVRVKRGVSDFLWIFLGMGRLSDGSFLVVKRCVFLTWGKFLAVASRSIPPTPHTARRPPPSTGTQPEPGSPHAGTLRARRDSHRGIGGSRIARLRGFGRGLDRESSRIRRRQARPFSARSEHAKATTRLFRIDRDGIRADNPRRAGSGRHDTSLLDDPCAPSGPRRALIGDHEVERRACSSIDSDRGGSNPGIRPGEEAGDIHEIDTKRATNTC